MRPDGFVRVRFRDPSLPHQIVIVMERDSNGIVISCNCMGTKGSRGAIAYEPIEVRTRWEHPEAMAVWRAHLESFPPGNEPGR